MLQLRGKINPVRRSATEPARPSSGGSFFFEQVALSAGPHTVRLQVQRSPFAQSELVTVHALLPADKKPTVELARDEFRVNDERAAFKSDRLTLSFELEQPQTVTFEGRAERNAASTHLRFLTQVATPGYEGRETEFNFYPPDSLPQRPLRFLVLGTTAVCNANCSHCPTNKAYSRAQAKGVMDMALFEKIVRDLAAMDFAGTIAFGLFGEPLQDPQLAKRVAMIRALCPGATISLSTNAAMYEPDKHRTALAQIDDIAIHIEALTPAVYETAMKPLKVRRTFPRAEQLISDHKGRVHVVSPVHRDNLDQVADLKSYWEQRGAGETELIALSNRSGESPNYEALCLAPTAVGCGPEMVITELVVDWDGAVLTCCQDFHRHGKIGDLKHESVAEALANQERARVRQTLNEKRWNELTACAGCKIDCETKVGKIVNAKVERLDHRRRFGADLFQTKGGVGRDGASFVLDSRNLAGAFGLKRKAMRAIVYGPHRRLTPGRYRARFEIDQVKTQLAGGITLDVTNGLDILARGRCGREGPWMLDFEVEAETGKLEFRVHARALKMRFSGVTVEKLLEFSGIPASE